MKWIPASRASAITCSAGSPVRKASSPSSTARGRYFAAEPEMIPIRRTRSWAGGEDERLALRDVADAGEEIGGGDPLGRELAEPADLGERLVALAPEALGELGVVAHHRMGVERQVVGGEADVVLEQRPQPLGERGRQPGAEEVPEQPVMDEHEAGLEHDGAVDQLALGADPRDDLRDRLAAGYLEPVRPEVGERTGIKQIVEC